MNYVNRNLVLLILFLLPLSCGEKADPASGADLYRFSVENQLDKPVSNAAVTVDLSRFDLPPGHCNYILHLVGTHYALYDGESGEGVFRKESGAEVVQKESGEGTFQKEHGERAFQKAAGVGMHQKAAGKESHQKGLFHQVALASAESGDPHGREPRWEIPSQCDDLTGNGIPDELFFLADFEAGQTLDFELQKIAEKPEYQQLTQAFLKVQTGGRFEDGQYRGGTGMEKTGSLDIPNEQVQGSGWAHMEGPVWESDLVGYRFYLDARNRVDIFGKSMPDLVLDTITQNYHQIHPWGTDVLVVGRSLGLGSLAAVKDGEVRTIDNWTSRRFEVPVNGPLRSVIRMTYQDWEVFGHSVTVVSEVEIHAANRYTEQRVSLSGDTEGLVLATGIVKHPDAAKLNHGDVHNSMYGWTSGDQADQGHGLDMGIVVPMVYQPEYRQDDPHTHLFVFRAVDGEAVYRYTSAWELDHDVVEDFHAHVLETAGLLTHPPKVRVMR